jgi:hypothetical protein
LDGRPEPADVKALDDVHPGITWSDPDSGSFQDLPKAYRAVSGCQSAVRSLLDGVVDRSHERVGAEAVNLLSLGVDQRKPGIGLNPGRQGGQRQDGMQRDRGGLGNSVGRRDSDAQPSEAARADPDGQRVEVPEAQPGLPHHAIDARHQLAGVARRLEQTLNRRLNLERGPVLAQQANGRCCGGGVEAEDVHSTVIRR